MKKPVVNISFLVLFVGLMINGMGQSVLFSILAPLSRSIGFMDSGVGIIISCSALMLVIFSSIWGRIIDKVNVKTVFIFGLLSFGIGSLVFAYVLELGVDKILLPERALILLIVIRMIYAAMTACTHPSAMAYVVKSTDEKDRVSSIALVSSSYSIGLVVGPALIFLSDYGSVLTPIYFTSLLAIFVALVSSFFLKNSVTDTFDNKLIKENKNSVLNIFDSGVFPVLISLMFINAILSSIQQSAGFLVQDVFTITDAVASKKTGFILSSLAFAMLFTQIFLIRKYNISYKKMVLIGYACLGVGLILIIFASIHMIFTLIVISTVTTGVGIGYLIPALQTHLSLSSSDNEQGKIAGYIFSFSAMGYIIGPLLGTGLISFGIWIPYLISIAMLILSALCMFIGRKNRNKLLAMG